MTVSSTKSRSAWTPTPEGTYSKLLIQNARVVDPRQKLDEQLDLLIENGRVQRIAKHLDATEETIYDATGLVLTPGLIDVHVHLREPGQEEKETIATGTAAAAMGGFSSVACMPNTVPPLDNESQIQYVMMKARSDAYVRVYPIGAVTKGQEGKELTNFGAMMRAGCVAISDDGKPIDNAQLFRRAMEYAKTFGLPLIDHCEDPSLFKGGVMNEGARSTLLGLKGIPRQAEYVMVARNIALCELTGGQLHLAHLSTKESVALVREAKKRGLPISAETCPHYFTLTEEAVGQYNTHAKMNPPLRTEADRLAVLEGIIDGTLEIIASDHAPHTPAQKAREFDMAPFGIIGLETTLPLVLTHLVNNSKMPLVKAIQALTDAPARLFHLPVGHLAVGALADITLIDLNQPVKVSTFASKSKNSPFVGMTLQGQAIATLVQGEFVMHAQTLLRKPALHAN